MIDQPITRRVSPMRSKSFALTTAFALTLVFVACTTIEVSKPIESPVVSASEDTTLRIPKITTQPAFPDLPRGTFGDRPVFLTYPPDDTNRVIVIEQDGPVHILQNNPATTNTTTFLDLSDKVSRDGNEEGLLSLAFHPDYSSNGHFYVYYSAENPRRSVLSRFTASSDPNRADPTSELIVLEIPQPYSNHNGGSIVFGPDNYLYIGLGDGGDRNDPHRNGQNPANLLGTIIRIDIDHPSGDLNYGIPADNPFANSPNGERLEIWAYGLRNPWRFSFDRANGDLWVGDVGQSEWEEIDLVEKGGNYGWNTLEGTHSFRPNRNCNTTGTILPVAEYDHASGCSVTGGHVYRGPTLPDLRGIYLYADFCSGFVRGTRPNGQQPTDPTLVAATNKQITSFGEDATGNLYILAFGGQVLRITSTE